MIKKEYGCFSEENFDNLIGYNLKGKKTSENETIPINSYSYNANYKACHINVDNACGGYIEFPFEQFSIGDVIEVEFECLTKENHVVVLFSSDSNKRVVPKTNYFTKYKCKFLVTENIKDRIKIGLGYANAGEFYIRNIKYSTIKKEYKFSKIKLEKDYCIRKNANTWELYTEYYTNKDVTIVEDSSNKCVNVLYDSVLYDPWNAAQRPIIQVTTDKTDYTVRGGGSDRRGFKLYIYDKTGNLVDPSSITTFPSIFINLKTYMNEINI